MNKRHRNRRKSDTVKAADAGESSPPSIGHNPPGATIPTKAGWRPKEWSQAVGCCKATTAILIADRRVDSVKLGAARIITTSPRDFLASLAEKRAAE